MVLIAGFNDGGDNWEAVEPAISSETRVCSYARFGTGASDPPTAPQTFATAARDLHALLSEIGETGPYVVVGHSYGGAQAVTFAARYREEVDGLVLLDATPPTWTAAVCAVPDDGSDAAADFVSWCPDPAHPTDNPEQLDEVASFAEVAAIDTLGSLPLSVVTAALHPFPGLDPVEAARLDNVWNRGQEHWMSLSSAAGLVTVEDSGHFIQLDRPDVVIAEIEGLLADVSTAVFVPAPVRWEPCGDRLQCGTLDVPVDPADPTGATISLSLARLPATEPNARIGTLITNPGGPGGSGVDFLGNDGPFNDEVNRRFDIVRGGGEAQWEIAIGAWHKRRRADQSRQPRQRLRVAHAVVEIELEEPTAFASESVDQTQQLAMGDHHPPLALRQRQRGCLARVREGAPVRHDEKAHRIGTRGDQREQQAVNHRRRERDRVWPTPATEPTDRRQSP